jgi:outer membrane protein assembly factor BamB
VNGGTGPHWAHPFISDGKLYLRHGDVLMVYNIKA